MRTPGNLAGYRKSLNANADKLAEVYGPEAWGVRSLRATAMGEFSEECEGCGKDVSRNAKAAHVCAGDAIGRQVGGSHYKDLSIQPVEYCQANGLNYCESNIVKYATRHRQKGGRQDLEKVIHYAELLIGMEYKK